jgi:UDP-glucose 4-epimerase
MPDLARIPEPTPLNPISPYGYTHAVIARLLSDLGAKWSDGTPWLLRYVNAAGSDPAWSRYDNSSSEIEGWLLRLYTRWLYTLSEA